MFKRWRFKFWRWIHRMFPDHYKREGDPPTDV